MQIEEELTAIWKDILGDVNIYRDSNFFHIGGHSLRAIQLASRIRKKYKIQLLVKELFSINTIVKQAAMIEDRTAEEAEVIHVVEKKPFYELSHSQKRIWITEQGQMQKSNVYNISASFAILSSLTLPTIIGAFEQVIRRHESLRTTFSTTGGQPCQRIDDDMKFTPVIYDLREEADAWVKANEKIIACAEGVFDLEQGPLFRVQIYRIEDEKWIIQMVMHHIISDGWSVQVLIRDFLEYYQALDKNREPSVKPLPIQYKDFAAWHNRWVNSDKRKEAEQYWQQKLGGSLPALNLATDRIRPERRSGEGKLMSFTIPSQVIDPILKNSQSQKAVIVLALSIAILNKYTGQNDIIIGMPFAGRFLPDLEDQVGCYINTLPLRIRFSPDDSFTGLVAICEREMLHAFGQEALPLDLIMERMETSAPSRRSSLFDVSVSYNNFDIALRKTHDFPVDKVERILFSQKTSKFDLTFHFYDAPDGFSVSFEYNTDIFFEERISTLYKHLELLMTEAGRSPDLPLKDIRVWDDIEIMIMEILKDQIHVGDIILLNDDFMKNTDDPEMPARVAASLNQSLEIQLSAGDVCLFPSCYALAGYVRNNISSFQ